ncbi:MAG: type I restriction enzyme HsdR N-terminal domain-containing protein [Chloroflexi bacterium]|nr:type I restriction enzyme HsdR N-terminal domain-containing protein [Chloroflexota bacterium]MCY3696995.1 type I restriction enzyme HsdR N-terminal domain-containing protein [Chloroflexota bacterium]
MVLEDLHELIETLQARIDAHAPALRQSEALTRYALIDPLLSGLGWDTGDPSQVMPEYRSAAGSADYALLGSDESPRIIVEAKRLGTPLQPVATQGINYCVQSGVPYFALTDGQHWELYETFRPVPLEDKVVVTLDLKSSVVESCLDAMALWQSSVSTGNIRQSARPVVEANVVASQPQPSSDPPSQVGAVQVETGDDWKSLRDFAPEPGTKPSALRFPDGKTTRTANWADYIAEIVDWLRVAGSLTAHHLPVRFGDQTNNVISAVPPNDPGFSGSGVYRQVGDWYVRTNYTGGQHAGNAQRIIELAGLNPADFAVKLQ